MKTYTDGLITGYDRVIKLIEDLDPKGNDANLTFIKKQVDVWKFGYQTFRKSLDENSNLFEGYRKYLDENK